MVNIKKAISINI